MSELANLPEITELIKYALFSDYVELDEGFHETVLSVMVVAPPGEGKSSAQEQFVGNDGLLKLGNVTAWGIENLHLADLKKGVYKRILIPDFVNPMAKKKATVDSLIVFFNSYISWEGVTTISTYGSRINIDEPVKGGLLTTMATKDFQRMVKGLTAIGFLSRILIVGYEYKQAEIDSILDDIIKRQASWGHIQLEFPTEIKPVKISEKRQFKMKSLALSVGNRGGDLTGIRALHQLNMLCKCKALSEGRDEVSDDDVHRIMFLADHYIGQVGVDARAKKLLKERG